MKRGTMALFLVGLSSCVHQAQHDRVELELEAWPAKQQACFDALDAAHMDLNVSGALVNALTFQDINSDITLSFMMKQQLRRSLEGYMTALSCGIVQGSCCTSRKSTRCSRTREPPIACWSRTSQQQRW